MRACVRVCVCACVRVCTCVCVYVCVFREREQAIEAFQTKEFIDFALNSAQSAQQISLKEEQLRAEEDILNQEKLLIMDNIVEMKKIREQLEIEHRQVLLDSLTC